MRPIGLADRAIGRSHPAIRDGIVEPGMPHVRTTRLGRGQRKPASRQGDRRGRRASPVLATALASTDVLRWHAGLSPARRPVPGPAACPRPGGLTARPVQPGPYGAAVLGIAV